MTTAGLGHNGGPAMDKGHRWRTHQWRKAQKAMMPNTIPLMVVRMRMRRAQELGMDYKTYARVRQASGRDILGLLFSSNALRIIADGARLPDDRAARLGAVQGAQRLTLVHRPHDPATVVAANAAIDAAERAPTLLQSWSETACEIGGFIRDRRLPSDGVLVIGDAPLETEWAACARAAGYLRAEQFFATAP